VPPPELESKISNEILEAMEGKPKKEQFKVFHFLFKKSYDINTEEGIQRYKNFKDSLKYIKEQNALPDRTYTLGITQFNDLTHEEFKSQILMSTTDFQNLEKETYEFLKETQKNEVESDYFDKHADDEDDENEHRVSQNTTTYDWSNSLLAPRDQGQCGSCFTFAATGAMEGEVFRKTGVKAYLSTQQLVDCDDSTMGCGGGLPNLCFRYVATNGIVNDSDYPYTSGKTRRQGVCNTSTIKNKTKQKVVNYSYCTNSRYEAEQVKACTNQAWLNLLSVGPLSVSMDASTDRGLMYYKSGIWNPSVRCGMSNHAIVAIGWSFDTTINANVLTVRNSWSTGWGENGNFRAKYNPNNAETCGLTNSGYRPNM